MVVNLEKLKMPNGGINMAQASSLRSGRSTKRSTGSGKEDWKEDLKNKEELDEKMDPYCKPPAKKAKSTLS